jgi:hypothetical protein
VLRSCTLRNADMMRASVLAEYGSRFRRMDPATKYGSCGMAFRCERISLRGILERSNPSMRIVPELSSSMRNNARINELLPLKLISTCFANRVGGLPSTSTTDAELFAGPYCEAEVFQCLIVNRAFEKCQ